VKYSDLTTRIFSARAGRAHVGTDAKSAPFLRPKKGFTLVEVIVVLVILAILAAVALPALTGYIEKAKSGSYIAEARDMRQTVVIMQMRMKADQGLDMYRCWRTTDYYFEATNRQFSGNGNNVNQVYRIVHITAEGGAPGGKVLYKELTGEDLKNRTLSGSAGTTAPVFLIVDKSSAIVAGWYMSKDCNRVVTWGIKQKDQITWAGSTYNLNNGNEPENGNVCSADIDPSVGYITYTRESNTSGMYR
jgi:prepilin-type N-terminal cleavage/methylation domain-containing protein